MPKLSKAVIAGAYGIVGKPLTNVFLLPRLRQQPICIST